MSSDDCCHSHAVATSSVFQTLDELDFERGIWNSALNGEDEKLKRQLDSGIDPNKRDSSGYTALLYVSKYRTDNSKLGIMDYDCFKRFALSFQHYAARNGKESICVLLLQRRANVNAKTHGGATPLLRAASQGHVNVVRLLLKNSADPTICDSDGKTPLHKAVEGSHFNVAKELLNYDANLKNLKDNKGNAPSFYVKADSVKFLELF